MSSVDPAESRSDFSVETTHIRAGLETVAADALAIEQLCAGLRREPFEISVNGKTFHLGTGTDSRPASYYLYPVAHPRHTGGRRTPGLRITSSEEHMQVFPDEQLLSAELCVADPAFRDVADLLDTLDLPADLLRRHILPHADVVAPAPAIVRASALRNGIAHVAFAAATGLERSAFEIKSILTTDGEPRRGTLQSSEIPWQQETDASVIARIDFSGGIKEASVSLSYFGAALELVTKAESFR